MSGVNIIRLNEQEITPELIDQLIKYHEEKLQDRYTKLGNYYLGEHDILKNTVTDESKPNNKLVNNYAKYIVDVINGYFIGKPISYTCDDDTYLQKLQEIFDYNDEQDNNSEISKKAGIDGHCYEVVFTTQGIDGPKIEFAWVDASEMILVYDTKIKSKPLFAVRYYKSTTDVSGKENLTYSVTVYTKNEVIEYLKNGGEITEQGRTPHYFKEVPVIEYISNDERLGDFETVITLIDAYNKMESDSANAVEYFADAYLMLVNLGGTDDKELAKMKENRVMLLDENGDAKFLTKDINDTFLENFKSRLKQDIHKFSMTPNLTDEDFAGQLSGVALQFKLWGLEQISSIKERKFKKSLQKRIKLITNILNTQGNNFNPSDIQQVFSRNIPQNVKEIADMIKSLSGIISEETAIAQLPFIDDVKAEFEKKKQEQEDNLSDNYNDLEITDANNIEDDMKNAMSGVVSG